MTLCTLAAGNVFLGTYRKSHNYFYLKPGQVYHYDRTTPYLNPRSYMPYSHAVTMIGSGEEFAKSPNRETKVHLNFQNNAGHLFGDNGFGKVGSSSERNLYRIIVWNRKRKQKITRSHSYLFFGVGLSLALLRKTFWRLSCFSISSGRGLFVSSLRNSDWRCIDLFRMRHMMLGVFPEYGMPLVNWWLCLLQYICGLY